MSRNHALPAPHASQLLRWYDRYRRTFPWRAADGQQAAAYHVWLSEIMLQQTTTTAVIPYFEKFLRLWPKVTALADAPVTEVMSAWAGLGYYSRARNLHACAKLVAERQGEFPRDEAELRLLPGIGPYTAAAIAAIAFGKRAVVVDGNIERVISRLYAIETPMPVARPEIRAAMDLVTPAERCGDFAQAMMDLGATICQPKRPNCLLCPFQPVCRAAASGTAETYPRKLPKSERPERRGAVFHLQRADGAILVRSRPPKGLLGGMTELPTTDWTVDFDLETAAQWAPVAAEWQRQDISVRHVFTHFALELTIFHAKIADGTTLPSYRWVTAQEMALEAWPTLMDKVLKKVLEDQLRVSLGKKRALVPFARQPEGPEGPDLLVFLDDVAAWEYPADEDISLEDLAKLTEIIEAYCDKADISVEFE
eukprot:gene9615-9692_t